MYVTNFNEELRYSIIKIKSPNSELADLFTLQQIFKNPSTKLAYEDSKTLAEANRVCSFIETFYKKNLPIKSTNTILSLICSLSEDNLSTGILLSGYSEELKTLDKVIKYFNTKEEILPKDIIKILINKVNYDNIVRNVEYRDIIIFCIVNLFLQRTGCIIVLETSDRMSDMVDMFNKLISGVK